MHSIRTLYTLLVLLLFLPFARGGPLNPRPHHTLIGLNECTRYVALDGEDTNNGSSPMSPWRTLQKAATSARPGDVVCVRGGVYNEQVTLRVSGTANAPITFRNYPGESPVLDGIGLPVPDTDTGLVHIEDSAYISVQGFEIRNYTTSVRYRVPVAILITGSAHHIEVRDNVIHHIEHRGHWAEGTDAHGIAVYGTSAIPIHDILIQDNELHHLRLGSSEALVINGNVKQWEITHNVIHDVDNIGIDAIGFEGTAPTDDWAREGRIAYNHVYNVDTYGNPAYGTDRAAACIYVDGGQDIIVENNWVHHCNLGLEIASEHPAHATRNVIVRNNFIYQNSEVGVAMGGYDTHRGATENCAVVNNTLYHNNTSDDWGAELYLQYDIRNTVIENNLIYAGEAGWFIRSWSPVMQDNEVDYNLYYTDSPSPRWEWQGHTYETFAAYRAASGNDSHSLHGHPPLLLRPEEGDLHLTSRSPAVNAGHLLPQSGSHDIDGEPRVQGGRVDIGADEYHGVHIYMPTLLYRTLP